MAPEFSTALRLPTSHQQSTTNAPNNYIRTKTNSNEEPTSNPHGTPNATNTNLTNGSPTVSQLISKTTRLARTSATHYKIHMSEMGDI